jgi:DinB superfamily
MHAHRTGKCTIKNLNMPLSASIRTRLRHQQETISELIADLSDNQLKQRINPDKWSAFEHIAHLAAYQLVFIKRLEKIMGTESAPEKLPGGNGAYPKQPAGNEEPPAFERYVAERDPLFPEYLGKTVSELLADIARDRCRITAFFPGTDDEGRPDTKGMIDDRDLLLTARHPKYGLMTTVQWTEFFLLHEAHHLFTIFMLTQDLRSSGAIDPDRSPVSTTAASASAKI